MVERGIVIAERPVVQAGEDPGTGAAVGVVVGATAGAVIGAGGVGRAVGDTVGSVVGGTAGAAAGGAVRSRDGMAYTVALDDGRTVTVMQHRAAEDGVLPLGAVVTLTTHGTVQHVGPPDGA